MAAGCKLGDDAVTDPKVVSAKLGLTLPATVTKARARAEGFQDWIYRLEFELSNEDLEHVAEQLGIELSESTDMPYMSGDWWTPVSADAVSWGGRQTAAPNRNWALVVYSAGLQRRWVRLQVFDS